MGPKGLEVGRYLRWRRVALPSYPLFLYLGMVLGLIAQNVMAIRMGLPSARIYVATLLLLIPGLVGSRLLFVITRWEIYRAAPRRLWDRSEGGLALYGGVVAVLLASPPLLAALDVPFGAFWDVATIAILIGAMLTKVGCLLNGCCGGHPTQRLIGIRLRNYHGTLQRRIPVPLLEIGWIGLVLLGLCVLAERRPFPGALYAYALGGYGLGRLLLEPLREEQDRLGRWALHQLIAAATVAACAAVLWFGWPRA